ncbi:hypothetical protein HMPREF0653_01933 [Prevotella disiens JCM 6334 = ATCC 29426]|uniref:Uncharacterized protein n=1 Tax=Prevotella disiens JCM 6334 = ATCC 29426 TaxID=1235811 RepID=A0ABN0NQF8_9BACT|nr:hypothetical protein HMPREF0653_01933 [Prevotella disiens JCM 6334 = ATCC 29426]
MFLDKFSRHNYFIFESSCFEVQNPLFCAPKQWVLILVIKKQKAQSIKKISLISLSKDNHRQPYAKGQSL